MERRHKECKQYRIIKAAVLSSGIPALCACAATPEIPVRGWVQEEWTVSVQRLPDGQVFDKCNNSRPLCGGERSMFSKVMLPYAACAWIMPRTRQCVIYLGQDAPDSVLAHERLHCQGRLHSYDDVLCLEHEIAITRKN
jgi:hypothetical protein